MSDRVKIGTHEVWREPDTGFIGIAHNGLLDGKDAEALIKVLLEYTSQLPPGEASFILADHRNATGMTGEARKVFTSSGTTSDTSYLAIYGMSFAFGIVFKLLMKAFALVSPIKLVASAVTDEAEARVWLTEQQRRYRAQKSSR